MFFISYYKRYVITSIIFLTGILVLTAPSSAFPQEPAKKQAVATFSILGDIVKNVAGDRIELSVLVGPGNDSHIYSPSPADARTLKNADIVFENGLEFEGWMERLVKSSGSSAKVAVASHGIVPIEADDHDHDETEGGHHHGHHHDIDPHAWQNVANVKVYVANIRDALIGIDPAGKAAYEENAKGYLEKLDILDRTIRETVAAIPADRRKVITSHDAFGYFAKAYGVAFIGLQGVSSDSEASARDVATIVRQIKAERIPAVFVETISDSRLMDRIAGETGAKIGKQVYSDSLSGNDGPAATYIDMMEHNVKAFSEALKPSGG